MLQTVLSKAVHFVRRLIEDAGDQDATYRAQLERFKDAEMIRPTRSIPPNLRVMRAAPRRRWWSRWFVRPAARSASRDQGFRRSA